MYHIFIILTISTKINLNNNYYFRDLIHYDYDAGKLIMESINKNNSLPYIVSKKYKKF